jgi:hypothetical protein
MLAFSVYSRASPFNSKHAHHDTAEDNCVDHDTFIASSNDSRILRRRSRRFPSFRCHWQAGAACQTQGARGLTLSGRACVRNDTPPPSLKIRSSSEANAPSSKSIQIHPNTHRDPRDSLAAPSLSPRAAIERSPRAGKDPLKGWGAATSCNATG